MKPDNLTESNNPSSSNTNRYCVISAVGKNSLHRRWIAGSPMFDLHLVVYDDSFEKFKNDTSFITQDKGFKFRLIYRYLKNHKDILDHYDYFYIPDDDIDIDTENIHRLFGFMDRYELAIAQPAIHNEYFTFKHTTKHPDTLIRFTNFVEIMQPCFSREALKKVLFTLNGNGSGWGIDYHWGRIVNYELHNMAIIDDIFSIHTRPVSTNHSKDFREGDNYIRLYGLDTEIKIIGSVPCNNCPQDMDNILPSDTGLGL